MPHILICALASTAIGTGHVRRMTTLVAALQPFDPDKVTLLTTPLGAKIAQSVDCGPLDVIVADTTDPRTLSGTILNDIRPDILILDNYHWAAEAEAPLKAGCSRLVVVDDLADRPHAADLLLDQNAHHKAADYRALVPANCGLAVGADYCMISTSFLAERQTHLPDAVARTKIDQVFVSLGGGDPGNQLVRLIKLLLRAVPDRISLATGRHIDQADALRSLARQQTSRLDLVFDSQNVAQQMNTSGWAVSAGGTMTWERAVLGLPSVSLILAQNQERAAAWMTQQGMQTNFEMLSDWDDEAFCQCVAAYRADTAQRVEHAMRTRALIDGEGAVRVARKIMALSA